MIAMRHVKSPQGLKAMRRSRQMFFKSDMAKERRNALSYRKRGRVCDKPGDADCVEKRRLSARLIWQVMAFVKKRMVKETKWIA